MMALQPATIMIIAELAKLACVIIHAEYARKTMIARNMKFA